MGVSSVDSKKKKHIQNLADLQRSVKGAGKAEIETLTLHQSDMFITIQKKGCLPCKTRRKLGI